MNTWKKALRRILILVLVGVVLCQAQNISVLASKISLRVLAETISGPAVIGDKVYTGGLPVSIEGSGGYTTITVDGDVLVSNSTGQYYIYDEAGSSSIVMTGGNVRDIYGCDGEITIHGGTVNNIEGNGSIITIGGGTINNLYGGGNSVTITGGSLGTVYGEGAAVSVSGGGVTTLYGDGAQVTVSGSAVIATLYGGSNSDDVDSTNVEITGGTITNLYGGGNSGGVSEGANVVMSGGTVVNLYGGSDTGTVGSVSLVFSGGMVTGEVYGDSINGGEVEGTVQIEISGTANAYRVTGVRGEGSAESVQIAVKGGTVNQVAGVANGSSAISVKIDVTGGTVVSAVNGLSDEDSSAEEIDITVTGGTVAAVKGMENGSAGSVDVIITGGIVTAVNGQEDGTADQITGYITVPTSGVDDFENLLYCDGTRWTVTGNVVLPTSVAVLANQKMVLGTEEEAATLSVPEDMTLHVEKLNNLTGNGELLGDGDFTTATFMPDMLVGYEDLVYIGEDLGEDIANDGTYSYMEAAFRLDEETAAKWTKTFTYTQNGTATAVSEVINVGNYTVVYTKEGEANVTQDFTVVQSKAVFEEESITFYKADGQTEISDKAIPIMDTFSVIVAAPFANGIDATSEDEEYTDLYGAALGGQVELYLENTKIAGPVNLDIVNSRYAFTGINLSSLTGITIAPNSSYTITAKYLGDENMAACETTTTVTFTSEAAVTRTDGSISHHNTLSSAVEAAQAAEGSVLTVYANDMVLEGAIAIDSGNFTLNLNGNTISSNLSEPAISINGASVVIMGGGKLANISNSALLISDGVLAVKDSTFSGNSEQGAIAYNGGILSMEGAVVLNNGGTYPGICVNGTNPISVAGALSGGPYSVSRTTAGSQGGVFATLAGGLDLSAAAGWFTSAMDGYFIVAEGSSLYLKEDISNATVTFTPANGVYNGAGQVPTVNVEIGGSVLTQNTDYTVSFTNAGGLGVTELTDAGSYTATIIGTGNYTGKKTAAYTVNKADIRVASLPTAAAIEYGQALEESALTGGSVVIENSTTEVLGSWKWSGGSVKPNAGTYTGQAVFTPVGANVNYANNFNALAAQDITLSIHKKSGYTVSPIEKKYLYFKGGADRIRLSALLPADCGNISYSSPSVSTENITFTAGPTVSEGDLAYTVGTGIAGNSGSITVVATTDNYEDITLTFEVTLVLQTPVEVKGGSLVSVRGTPVYGDTLADLEFNDVTFVEQGTDKEVSGTLVWKEPDKLLNAGAVNAEWIFTPDDEHYAVLEGIVVLNVDRAIPTIHSLPTVADRVYHPSVALMDGDLIGGNVTGVDGNALEGTWGWLDANVVPIVSKSKYLAVFIPADTSNYKSVSVNVTVNVSKATPYIAEMPVAADITYGQTISEAAIIGGVVYHSSELSKVVSGSFIWLDGSPKPTVADSGVTTYSIVFVPVDAVNYNAISTKITLVVNRADNPPNMPAPSMDVAYECGKLSDVTLPDGWVWQEEDAESALMVGVPASFTAVYTGDDGANYINTSVEVLITRLQCKHKAGKILYTGEGEKEPTCTKKGLGHKECTKCNAVIEDNIEVDALGHKYTKEVTKEPTTTKKGVMTYTCLVCGHKYKESIDKLPPEEEPEEPDDNKPEEEPEEESGDEPQDKPEEEPSDEPEDKPEEEHGDAPDDDEPQESGGGNLGEEAAGESKDDIDKSVGRSPVEPQTSGNSGSDAQTQIKEEAESNKQAAEVPESLAPSDEEPETIQASAEPVKAVWSPWWIVFVVLAFAVGIGVGVLCMKQI